MSKKPSKYIRAFNYFDKTLIALFAASGRVSIISFVSDIDDPVGVASAGFSIVFSLTTEIVKKLSSITRNENKNHKKIFLLAKRKLNSIETLISQALIDLEISHKEFKTIVNEKEKYWKIKESIRMMESSNELN